MRSWKALLRITAEWWRRWAGTITQSSSHLCFAILWDLAFSYYRDLIRKLHSVILYCCRIVDHKAALALFDYALVWQRGALTD